MFFMKLRKEKGTFHISMVRAHFESYVKFFGEPQHHRQVHQKSDRQNIEVICLLINVRQYEIWIAINNALESMGKLKLDF